MKKIMDGESLSEAGKSDRSDRLPDNRLLRWSTPVETLTFSRWSGLVRAGPGNCPEIDHQSITKQPPITPRPTGAFCSPPAVLDVRGQGLGLPYGWSWKARARSSAALSIWFRDSLTTRTSLAIGSALQIRSMQATLTTPRQALCSRI